MAIGVEKRFITKRVLGVIVAAIAAGYSGSQSSSVSAATITYGTPATFSDDSVLLVPAVGGYAVDFENPTGAVTTTTAGSSTPGVGVTFAVQSAATATVTVATSYSTFLTGVPTTTGDTGFDTVLSSGAYTASANNAKTGTITLNNLTIGTAYQVQLFFVDSRTSQSGRTFIVGDGSATPTTTAKFQYAYGTTGNTIAGAYITGSFTADATTEAFTSNVFSAANAQTGTQINALVLTPTPEPTSLALLGAAGVGMLARRRKAV